jgi:membrane protease YdiL (CAAX protease family)
VRWRSEQGFDWARAGTLVTAWHSRSQVSQFFLFGRRLSARSFEMRSPQQVFRGLGLGVPSVLLALLYGVVKTGFPEELLFRGLIALQQAGPLAFPSQTHQLTRVAFGWREIDDIEVVATNLT